MSNHLRRGRAWRRHDVQRLKESRKHHASLRFSVDLPPKAAARRLGQRVATAAPCSCWMCRNPRRTQKERLTLAERRHRQAWDTSNKAWHTDL